LTSRFNFYDIVGYVIPGAAGLLVLYLLYTFILLPASVLALPTRLPTIPGGDVSIAALFIGASYLFGQLIQQAGDWVEHLLVNQWRRNRSQAEKALKLWAGQHFGVDFLTKGSELAYQEGLRNIILATVCEAFGIKPDICEANPQMAYDLCRVAMYEKDPTGRPEIFLGISGLSRAMIVVSLLGLVVTLLMTARGFGLLRWIGGLDAQGLWLAPIGSLFFVVTGLIWVARFQNYSRQYANAVLQTFAGWGGLVKMGLATAGQTTGGAQPNAGAGG